MKKYELLENETITVGGGVKLYRIKACRSFKSGDKTVNEGDLGGYIQCEDNLSHDGNAWIYDNARVYGNAKVFGNARVYSHAEVYGKANVYGDALISGHAKIYGNAQVLDNTRVYDNATVFGGDISNS